MSGFRHFLLATLTALVLAWTATGRAEDPLDDAREAQRAGDTAVLAVLRNEQASTRDVLSAIRRARFLRMPELALEPLARVALGRDPALAPEAALVSHVIATSLDLATLESHEITPSELEAAKTLLTRLARDTSARADLRALAANAARHIAALTER